MEDKKPMKFIGSIFNTIICILILPLAFAIWGVVFYFFLQGGNNATSAEAMTVVFIIVSIFVPFSIFIFYKEAVKSSAIYTISEKGIRRSRFLFSKSKEFLWEEIQELGCCCQHTGFFTKYVYLYFSKTQLRGMSFRQMNKNKEIIFIFLTQKRLKKVQEFTNLPILNLPSKL